MATQRRVEISAPLPIGAEHDLSRFDCGDDALNVWLKTRAVKGEGRHARTYVACFEQAVVGYYCICSGSVERAATPGRMRKNAPEVVPVSIIGRLAVHKEHKKKGIGADLLADAFRRIVHASQVIGITAVMVHAKDHGARTFYLSCAEFIEYPADSRTLFIPIKTIIDGLQPVAC